MAKTQRKRFEYKPRTKEQVRARANQKGGMFDSTFKDGLKQLKVGEGDHTYRIMPPTWDDADHYGLEVMIHYGVGPDNQAYLCREKLEKGTCPICAERRKAERKDPDYAKELAPTKRVLLWVIDRDKESEGPQLWSCPWTLDRDIAMQSQDKKTGEVFAVDDPYEGYDVSFTRSGADQRTKYGGIQLARRSSPLAEDEDELDDWLDYIQDNPLTECLVYYDEEYIAGIFAGGEAKRDKEDEEQEESPRTRSSRRREREEPEEEEEAPPPRRSRREREEPEEERPTSRRTSRPVGTATKSRSEEEEQDEAPPRRRERVRDKEEEEPESSKKSRSRELFNSLDEPEEQEEEPEEQEEEERPRRRRR